MLFDMGGDRDLVSGAGIPALGSLEMFVVSLVLSESDRCATRQE